MINICRWIFEENKDFWFVFPTIIVKNKEILVIVSVVWAGSLQWGVETLTADLALSVSPRPPPARTRLVTYRTRHRHYREDIIGLSLYISYKNWGGGRGKINVFVNQGHHVFLGDFVRYSYSTCFFVRKTYRNCNYHLKVEVLF